jgi:hypothetical protein
MNKVISTIGLLCAIVVANPCYAADGNALLAKCNTALNLVDGISTGGDSGDIGFCFGMMQGITFMNGAYGVMLNKKAIFCPPSSGITNIQAARIVVKYLRDHPEELHENEGILAMKAFIAVYPCK